MSIKSPKSPKQTKVAKATKAAAAVEAETAAKAVKARRYTVKEKEDIIAYVAKYNAENGRGGQSAASKKYKISPLTVATWLKSAGPVVQGISASSAGPLGKRLAKLQQLHDLIAKAEADLVKLRSQFDSLKASL